MKGEDQMRPLLQLYVLRNKKLFAADMNEPHVSQHHQPVSRQSQRWERSVALYEDPNTLSRSTAGSCCAGMPEKLPSPLSSVSCVRELCPGGRGRAGGWWKATVARVTGMFE